MNGGTINLQALEKNDFFNLKKRITMKNKKLTLIIAFMFFIIKSTNAQCDETNSKNTISTDWNNYHLDPNNFAKYPNIWNWTIPGNSYYFYLYDDMDVTDSRRIIVELPYFCSKPQGSGGCEDDNLTQYHLVGNNGQDIYPIDGWELIGKDFGTPNTTGMHDGKKAVNPFFILYNKYNGKLKMFSAVIGSHSANKALITTKFSEDNNLLRTALLAHAKPIAQPLQTFEPMNIFKSLNSYELRNHTDDYYWLVSEIQTAYDPCTCNGMNKNSLLKFVTATIISSSITGTIEGTTTQTFADASTIKSETNKKTSFFELAFGVGKAGYESYTTFDGYKEKIKNGVDKYNTEYKKELVNAWFKEIHSNQFAGTFTTAQKNTMFNDFMSSEDNIKTMAGIKGVEKYNKYANLIKGVASYAPYVGTAIGVAEFFIGLSKKNNAGEQTETPPATYYSSFKLNGTITTENDVTTKVLFNPGHPNSGSDAFKPFYDNPLGVFHILKAPLVEYHDLVKQNNITIHTKSDEGRGYVIVEDNTTDIANRSGFFRQWNLTEDIKYVVNPASDLEVESIDAAFVLEYNKSEELFIPPNNAFNPITPFPLGKKFDKSITLEERINDIKDYGLELEYLTKDYPTGDNSYIRFRTEYAPLQCLKNVNFLTIGGSGGNMKVYVKMLVRLKVKNSNNFVTQIVMYDISKSFLNENAIVSQNTGTFQIYLKPKYSNFLVNDNSQMHESDWFFEKIDFNLPKNNFNTNPKIINFTTGMGNSNAKETINIKANQHIGDNITLTALEEINIEAGVTFGNNVLLRAGNAINVAQGVQITPNTKLEIIKDPQLLKINCTNPNIAALHATNTEIAAICTSTAYQTRAESVEVPNPKPIKPIIEKLNFNIYPNPNNGNFNVSVEEAVEAWQLTLLDITGKQILTQTIAKGQVLANIETVNLMSGIYLVTVKANGKERTEKLIIQSNN